MGLLAVAGQYFTILPMHGRTNSYFQLYSILTLRRERHIHRVYNTTPQVNQNLLFCIEISNSTGGCRAAVGGTRRTSRKLCLNSPLGQNDVIVLRETAACLPRLVASFVLITDNKQPQKHATAEWGASQRECRGRKYFSCNLAVCFAVHLLGTSYVVTKTEAV